MKSKLALVLATWFGVGYFPIAAGTLATFVTLPLAFGFFFFFYRQGFVPQAWFWPNLALAGLLFMPGVWAAGEAEDATGERDSHKIVVDEVLGTFLGLAFLSAQYLVYFGTYVWAFFLFRLFDVWKPFPIRQSQILPRGWGVMVDDVLAGLLAGVILCLVAHWHPGSLTWGRF